MIYIENRCTDPAHNLALEQHFFETLPAGRSCFMLWQNRPAVIIGRYQNTVEEINERFVRENDIRVVRRMTGGGAVYHDLGNLNYSFISPVEDAAELDFGFFCQPIIRALATLGVTAEVSGRNDIVIDGRKVSGTAQHVGGGRVLHHGTLLFDVDFARMAASLTPNKGQVLSDSSKSVRSRVTNIREHLVTDTDLEGFWALLRKNIVDAQGMPVYTVTDADEAAAAAIARGRYDTWDWNYGLSPACAVRKTRRIDGCGTLQLGLDVENGRLRTLTLHGDFFARKPFEDVLAALAGRRLELSDLADALRGVDMSEYIHRLSTEDFLRAILE